MHIGCLEVKLDQRMAITNGKYDLEKNHLVCGNLGHERYGIGYYCHGDQIRSFVELLCLTTIA